MLELKISKQITKTLQIALEVWQSEGEWVHVMARTYSLVNKLDIEVV